LQSDVQKCGAVPYRARRPRQPRQRRRLQLHFRTFGPLWFSGHAVLKSSQRNRQAPLVDELRFTRAADIERLDSTCKRRSPGYPQLLHAMSKTLPAVMLAAYCCKPQPASRRGIFAWKSVFRSLGSSSWIWRARRSYPKRVLERSHVFNQNPSSRLPSKIRDAGSAWLLCNDSTP
jgi:hypothetical protein